MNNKPLIAVALLLFFAYACSKKGDDAVLEEPDDTPLQLVKKIVRSQQNGVMLIDSFMYDYDEAGHLVAIKTRDDHAWKQNFIYEGDNLTGIVQYSTDKQDTLHHPLTISDNGNTMFVDYTRPNPDGNIDTIQITYKWSGEKLLESWTYLHFPSTSFQNFQKSLFSYDANGNEKDHVVVFNDGSSQWQTKVLAYDDKKNYFATIPRLNYVFGTWGFPYATRSVNNPVKGERMPGEIVEFIWTYNDDGYPLTMTEKGNSYVSLELQYNK
jgi:hypothetical protein